MSDTKTSKISEGAREMLNEIDEKLRRLSLEHAKALSDTRLFLESKLTAIEQIVERTNKGIEIQAQLPKKKTKASVAAAKDKVVEQIDGAAEDADATVAAAKPRRGKKKADDADVEEKEAKPRATRNTKSDLKMNEGGDGVNGMAQFCKWAWIFRDDFREQYSTPEVSARLAEVPAVKKCTNEVDRRVEEGKFFWEKVATDEQKKDIKKSFTEWKADKKKINDIIEPTLSDSDEAAKA